MAQSELLLQGMTQFSTSKRVFGLRQALILLLHIQNKTNPKNIFNTDSGVRLKHFPQFRNKNVKAATYSIVLFAVNAFNSFVAT